MENTKTPFEHTYSYVDQNRQVCKVTLKGMDQDDTDRRFQQFAHTLQSPSMTLKKFVETVFLPEHIDQSRTTAEKNAMYLRCYILKYVGDKELSTLSAADLIEFRDRLANAKSYGHKQDISSKSIVCIFSYLHTILVHAHCMGLVKEGLLNAKITFADDKKEKKKENASSLTVDNYAAILANILKIPNTYDRACAVLLMLGRPRGQILGIQDCDVHLDEQYISIARTITYPGNNHPECVDLPVGTPCRDIFLTRMAVKVLSELPSWRGFLFGGEAPLPFSTQKRLFQRVYAQMGVTDTTTLDFRRIYAMFLIEKSSLSLSQIAAVMGYKNTRMLEKLRTHDNTAFLHAMEKAEELAQNN